MKKTLAAAVAAAAFLPFTAAGQGTGLTGASDLVYNYVDVRYANQNVSGVSNPDGVVAEVSGKVADQFFVRASYTNMGSPFSIDQIVGEGGFIYPMMPGLDLIATAGVIYVSNGDSDTGFVVSGGARALLTPQFEVEGRLLYTDNDFYDAQDIDFDGEVGARFNFNRTWSVGANYRFDQELVTVGGRFNFGLL